jgi:hypothetical protein
VGFLFTFQGRETVAKSTGDEKRRVVKKKVKKLPLKRVDKTENRVQRVEFVEVSHAFNNEALLDILRREYKTIPPRAQIRPYHVGDDPQYNFELPPDGMEVFWEIEAEAHSL